MLRNVFLKTLWEQRHALLWWAVALIALAVYTAGIYPSIATPDFANYIQALPSSIAALFGETFSFATIEGYLNAYFFNMMGPLIFAIYAIAAGSGAIAGEEERGTLDVLLATPLSRVEIVLHKFAAMVVGTMLLGAFLWLGLVLATMLVDLQVNGFLLAQACAAAALVGAVFGAMALALGAARGSRGFSVGAATAIAIAAYVLKTYAPLVEGMKNWQKLSPFYYATASDPLTNGLSLQHAALMIAVSLVLLVVAIVAFQRRDVAV